IRPILYDGNVIAKKTNVISIDDLEETLMLKDESRSKMLLKQSDPKVLEKKINIKPVKYAVLNQLSKDFEVQIIFDQMETAVQQYSVDKQCLEIANNQVLNENNRLLEQIISQDIVNIVVNSTVNLNASVNVNENSIEMFNKCLELKAELIKQYNMIEKDEYNKLSKNYSQLEQHCISLELTIDYYSEDQYAVSIKEDMEYPCLHSPKTTKEQDQYAVSRRSQYAVKIDDSNITIEEYIRLEEENARRCGKVYNWETATYGKIWDNEDVHDLGSVETEFPSIVFVGIKRLHDDLRVIAAQVRVTAAKQNLVLNMLSS
ncbi:hypothetical protein Tco_1205944, partial [Tanacetum coccineum]